MERGQSEIERGRERESSSPGGREREDGEKKKQMSGKKANAIWVIWCFCHQFSPVPLEELNTSLTLTKEEQMIHFSYMLLNQPSSLQSPVPALYLLLVTVLLIHIFYLLQL